LRATHATFTLTPLDPMRNASAGNTTPMFPLQEGFFVKKLAIKKLELNRKTLRCLTETESKRVEGSSQTTK
jgi:hypothetical protein